MLIINLYTSILKVMVQLNKYNTKLGQKKGKQDMEVQQKAMVQKVNVQLLDPAQPTTTCERVKLEKILHIITPTSVGMGG